MATYRVVAGLLTEWVSDSGFLRRIWWGHRLVSADLYCWRPSLNLHPYADDFQARISALYREKKPAPSPTLVAFVQDLLTHYPDLTATEDTVWADGPLVGDIIGDFIQIGLIWSRYAEAQPVIIATAHHHGLHCYDPQSSIFYPLPPRDL